jgi:phospholipid/cholesterol/gamma-HCH transport system substrate-binding protein
MSAVTPIAPGHRRPARTVAAVLSLVLLWVLSGCSVADIRVPHRTITVTAELGTAAGVFVGNDVGVLGVPVGRITTIDPVGDRVRVTMEVDADQPVPAGAAAVVVSRSAATDRYVELTPVYRSGPRMQSGAVIPLDRTRTPVEFDEVLGSLSDLATGLAGSGETREAIKRLLATSSTAFRGKGELFNRSVRSLATATDGISAQRDRATSTLVALDRLTSTLATNQQTIRTFVRQVAKATALLAEERQNFRTALRSVTRMVRVVARFAQENRPAISRAVDQTNDVMRTVLDERAPVSEMLRTLPLAAQNLQRMLGPDDRLQVRLDITALLPVLGPVLNRLCRVAPADLCTLIGLDPIGALVDALGGLLGGGRK